MDLHLHGWMEFIQKASEKKPWKIIEHIFYTTL